MQELLRYNNNAKFLLFDFETEDLNLFSTKPWQYASVKFSNNSNKMEENNIFIKWKGLKVSKGAAIVTRFNPSIVENNGIDPKKALEIINKEFEEADYICGHNIISFDVNVYHSYCLRMGVKPLDIKDKLIDTMSLGKGYKLDYKPRIGENCQSLVSYQMKINNIIHKKRGFATLGGLCKDFDIDYDTKKAHDALYDVKVNAKLLKKMLWTIEI